MNRKILGALALLLVGMSPVLAMARPPGYYYGPRHERRWHRPPPPVWRRPPPPIWGYGPPPPPPPPPVYPYW
ncbi:hypothetical protein [Novacetimonas cocois]|uniref:Uncharacterized protein n=1 Tax=Novacetimonas cocois TaxID=1747507 RepID=A0A365YUQ0_9PROT|nr:hypothetical protein [Novacetimonas cocois]RBM06754.1 hypothetical protein NJLHNGOC_08895 [Novacetimonas cocois]